MASRLNKNARSVLLDLSENAELLAKADDSSHTHLLGCVGILNEVARLVRELTNVQRRVHPHQLVTSWPVHDSIYHRASR